MTYHCVLFTHGDLLFRGRSHEFTAAVFLTAKILFAFGTMARTQTNLQLRRDFIPLVLRDLGQKMCNQILLPALPKDHGVDGVCTPQGSSAGDLAKEESPRRGGNRGAANSSRGGMS